MIAVIGKSTIDGNISAPPSKSYTIRALICAALANGGSKLYNFLLAEDSDAAVRTLSGIGAVISFDKDGWRVNGGKLQAPNGELFCGESAATLRFLTAICSLIEGESRLTFGPSLAKRPIAPLLDALRDLGVAIRQEDKTVIVKGGKVEGGIVELDGDISSQFVSSLLMAAPLMEKGLSISLSSAPVSIPYIKMTLDILDHFGIKVETDTKLRKYKVAPQHYNASDVIIEGDWSSASCPLALGASGGFTCVSGLNARSFQADKIMLKLLERMGVTVQIHSHKVTASKCMLNALEADLTNSIDLLPVLAALAALAEGQSILKGIAKARLKESNRVLAMREGLNRMGIAVSEEEDNLIITGGKPNGAEIDSYGDHRIAMAFSIIGAAVGNTRIRGAECVGKTYPMFWQDFKSLGGKVAIK